MQKELLNKCGEFNEVRRLIYSTCSLHREENEDVADSFLQTHQGWKSVRVFKEWPHRGIDAPNYVRFSPERDQTDGFFIALFKRK
jgi:putative methyltransferase